jgi:PTH1 family peptidyl-tRNA hydrolase
VLRVVVGLGNPGVEYEQTRHNVGFAVLDAVAESVGIRFREGKGEFLIASGVIAGRGFRLVKPLTYMNNSGQAVEEIVKMLALNVEDLLVVADDFHLPLGALRLRRKGSSGGHNGLSSVISSLGSDEFPRLRCGIGTPEMPTSRSGIVEFVLSRFSPEEEQSTSRMILSARDAVMVAITEDVETAAQRYSRYEIK